jgi:hypothetical protein
MMHRECEELETKIRYTEEAYAWRRSNGVIVGIGMRGGERRIMSTSHSNTTSETKNISMISINHITTRKGSVEHVNHKLG